MATQKSMTTRKQDIQVDVIAALIAAPLRFVSRHIGVDSVHFCPPPNSLAQAHLSHDLLTQLTN
jgi:hypothetical protein